MKSFSEAINLAILECMSEEKNSVFFGLGATDPKRIFGTTERLIETFGNNRVFDVPTSENALTGMAVGLASSGTRVILSHQRFDFILLSFDQLINNAAKWSFMFGKNSKLPIVIRVIVGNGWGQGPTHSQSFHTFLASTPGLKVIIPSGPNEAYNLLIASIKYQNPVIFVEHRQLYSLKENLSPEDLDLKCLAPKIYGKSDKIVIVGLGYAVKAALDLQSELSEIDLEVWDLREVHLSADKSNFRKLRDVENLVLLDPGLEDQSWIHKFLFTLNRAPESKVVIIAHPNYPETTTVGGLKDYHVTPEKILNKLIESDMIENKLLNRNRQTFDNLQGSPTNVFNPF